MHSCNNLLYTIKHTFSTVRVDKNQHGKDKLFGREYTIYD
jgi:hypothetical protein